MIQTELVLNERFEKRWSLKPRIKRPNPHNNNMLPVFKINFDGDILYANNASLNLLHNLGTTVHRRLTNKFISDHKELLVYNANTDTLISTGNTDIHFSVVAFPEAGYIGFYAFHIESKN